MTEFSTEAEVSITVPNREIRRARNDLEEGLANVPVTIENGRAVRPDGGMTGTALAGGAAAEELGDQTELLEDILDEVEGVGGESGGSGGGLLNSLGLAGLAGGAGSLGLGALGAGALTVGGPLAITAATVTLTGKYGDNATYDEFVTGNTEGRDTNPNIEDLPGYDPDVTTPLFPFDFSSGTLDLPDPTDTIPDDEMDQIDRQVEYSQQLSSGNTSLTGDINIPNADVPLSERIESGRDNSTSSTNVNVNAPITVDGGSEPDPQQIQQLRREFEQVARRILGQQGTIDDVSDSLQDNFGALF